MADKSLIIPAESLPINTAQTVLTQTGDKNTAIAHADNVNLLTNIVVPAIPHSNNGAVINSGFTFNKEYYNLFVIGGETFSAGHFFVPINRALTESIAPEIAVRFNHLNDEAVSQIKTFPALFMSENHHNGHTSPDHKAYFGIVTDISVQENVVKIWFQAVAALPQQRLNKMAINLKISSSSLTNELSRTHWTIKSVNLLEELAAAGLSILGLT